MYILQYNIIGKNEILNLRGR